MTSFLRAAFFSLLASAALSLGPSPAPAQDRTAQERIIRDIESRGFRNITGLARRGSNYVFQAQDLFGERVRVVMNIETGEIVGLSRTRAKQK